VISAGTRVPRSVFLIAAVAGTTACTSIPPDSGKTTEPGQEIPTSMNLTGQIEVSKTDLAQRLDIPDELVVVSSARQVTWRSSALGCPEPGRNYTLALVPGPVIYLQARNTIHAYHGTSSPYNRTANSGNR
jgi:hypothetical protein